MNLNINKYVLISLNQLENYEDYRILLKTIVFYFFNCFQS